MTGVLRGFPPRLTGVRLGRKPLCSLVHRKNISFMNWKLFNAQMNLWMGTSYKEGIKAIY